MIVCISHEVNAGEPIYMGFLWSHKGNLLFIPTWVRSWLKSKCFVMGTAGLLVSTASSGWPLLKTLTRTGLGIVKIIWCGQIYFLSLSIYMDIFKQFITLTEQCKLLRWWSESVLVQCHVMLFWQQYISVSVLRIDRMTLSYAKMLGEDIWLS